MQEKNITTIALLGSFIGIFSLLVISLTAGNISREGPFNVTRVIDGDTLELHTGDIVRLSGIDAPETGTCYAKEAKDTLSQLVLNKEVYLEKDITDTGKYNRLLRYIYVDNVHVNAYLVEQGYVKAFHKYNSTTKKYKELNELEIQAKKSSIGVWSCKETNCLYIANKQSKIYHKSECKAARKIKQENQICITRESDTEGFKPAKRC